MKAPKRLKKLSFDELDRWFDTAKPRPPIQGASIMDGYLTALVISPQVVSPDIWLPRIVGPHQNMAFVGTKALSVIDTILGRYNEISEQLAENPKAYAPVFMVDEDGRFIPDDWANGFYAAFIQLHEAWTPLLNNEMAQTSLMAILVNAPDLNEVPGATPLLQQPPEPFLNQAKWIIPEAVRFLRDTFAPQRAISIGAAVS